MRALSKDPDQRYATADAFGRELQQIRKSLHPSVSTSQLDETRVASTMVMKALHQDLQQTRVGAKTGAGSQPAHEVGKPSRPKWLIPAGAAALVIVGAIGYFAMTRSAPPAAPTPTTTTASNAPAPSGPATTAPPEPAAAATSPPPPPVTATTAPPAPSAP